MGFPGYFLVVADFINWSKNNGIRVGPGRGSGAGSMAAYAMRITDLDPLEHGLIFERFLNPDRVSMPDFDVDFDDRRRGEVIELRDREVRRRARGPDRDLRHDQVEAGAQGCLARARVPLRHGRETHEGDAARAVMAKDIPLSGITDPKHGRYKEAAEFRAGAPGAIPTRTTVYETALGLEGLKRQWGVHAAGVIMSSDPLIDIIPIMKREQDGQIVTQFDYPTCEGLGLIKMDFLGLRNLTIISDALENIQFEPRRRSRSRGARASTTRTAYELLARGDTLGRLPARRRADAWAASPHEA